MREATYIRKIKKLLANQIYAWKVADRYTAGVPDAWYSGTTGDLWVEYKWVRQFPKKTHAPAVSALQDAWLTARQAEGRRVAVVVGSPQGAQIYLNGSWARPQPRAATLLSPRDLAAWIVSVTTTPKASTT